MTDIRKGGTHASLSSVFESGKYSDLIIRSGDRVFKVHRAVICPRSRFFAAACDGPFQECISKEISLEEDDPHTVERMLAYLYTSDYCDRDYSGPVAVETSPEELQPMIEKQDNASTTTNEPSLLNNVLVYAIAEKYGITGLKEMAQAKFQSQAGSLLSAKEFPEIIRELYRSTPSSDRGLRDIVSQLCAQRGRTIIDNSDLNSIIVEIGEFGLDLLCEVLKYENKRFEEAITTNIALGEELKKRETETMELQRRVSSVSKVLRKVAKEVETGKITGSMVIF
ncbi:hypothetical protein BGZ60DRAFT_417837 [Tricladium varicosporioides]|nr:hypothetical protein BGZ60DRAFT_417837 [Hymenoscyphus varicosporioides]